MRTSITCLLALLLSAAGHTFAQNIKAALNGRVLDSQNNAVANAAIIVTDLERGQSRSLVADAQGGFHLAGLEPGVFRLSGAVNDTNHPSLSLSEDGRLLLVFQGREPAEKDGWGPVRAFLTEIYDNGAVSAPFVIPGSKKTAQFPTVVAGTVGRVFVAWTEATDKGAQVALSRGRKGVGAATEANNSVKSKKE